MPYGENMKNILIGLLMAFAFVGCSGKDNTTQNIEPKLVLQNSLAGLSFNDQHEKTHTLSADTKTLIFAFSKDVGHTCNDFFATKKETYLDDHKAIFVADVSSAPSIIRSMFIMPGLKDFKHTVLIIDDENTANSYKKGLDVEKIIIVTLSNNIITSIDKVTTTQELAAKIEAH